MTKILNLNTMSAGLPFRWYPVTELFRDFLREKTLPEGLCITSRAFNKIIYIDQGVDRDIFIDNYLVSDFAVIHGKLYCQVALDDVIMLGRQAVSGRIYEAIISSPPLRRDPFVADNLLFQILEKDVQSDGEEFPQIINEVEGQEIPDLLAVMKFIFTRLGDKDLVDKILGSAVSEMASEAEYADLAEMLKMAALMLEDKRSAERIFLLLSQTSENAVNHIYTAAIKRYILNQKTDNGEILQAAFSVVEDSRVWVKTVRNLAIYFDFNYAKDVYKKGLKHLKYSFDFLDAALLAEYLFGDTDTAEKMRAKSKELSLDAADAAYFHFYYVTTNKEKEFSDQLLQLHSPLEEDFREFVDYYLTNVKYREENPDQYNRLVEQIIASEIPAAELLEVAFELFEYNSLTDDLGGLYEAAKDRTESSVDYTHLARWVMECDISKEREASKYLKEADQLAESPEDHLELGILLAQHGKGKLAEKHLKIAQNEIEFSEELIEIAEAWYELGKNENAKRALLKAEKCAQTEEVFKEIATLWMIWFDDTASSKRCIGKSVEAGWGEQIN